MVPRGGIEFPLIELKLRHFSNACLLVYPSMYRALSWREKTFGPTFLHAFATDSATQKERRSFDRNFGNAIDPKPSAIACWLQS
jgi:hypothetical protein